MKKSSPPGGKAPRTKADRKRLRRRPARGEERAGEQSQRHRPAREKAWADKRRKRCDAAAGKDYRQGCQPAHNAPHSNEGSPGKGTATVHTWRRQRPVETAGSTEVLAGLASSQVGPGGYLHFGDIPAHRLGRELRGELYRLANSLDEDERFNLAARIKYAATTVTAALATGFGEGSFRAGVTRSLESRGALYGLQDHLQQLHELGLLDEAGWRELSGRIDEVVMAINQYLGLLVRERRRIDIGT